MTVKIMMTMNVMITMNIMMVAFAKPFLDPNQIKNVNFHLLSGELNIIHVLVVAREDNLGALQIWMKIEHIKKECGDIVILLIVLWVNRMRQISYII